MVRSPPSGAGETECARLAGYRFPNSHHSLGAKQGPRFSGARGPQVARAGIAEKTVYLSSIFSSPASDTLELSINYREGK